MWEHPMYPEVALSIQQLSLLSAERTAPSTEPDGNLLRSQTTTDCNLRLQQPATGSHSPNHSHKLCQLTNSKAGRPAGAQNKSQPRQSTNIIHSLLTSKGMSTLSTKGVMMFDRTAMMPHTFLRRVTQHYTRPAQLSHKACHYCIRLPTGA